MTFRLRSSCQKTLEGVTFVAKPHFTPGLLPAKQEVIEVMIFHLQKSTGRSQLSKAEAAAVVAGGLMQHWINQNVYTIARVI